MVWHREMKIDKLQMRMTLRRRDMVIRYTLRVQEYYENNGVWWWENFTVVLEDGGVGESSSAILPEVSPRIILRHAIVQ